LVSCRWASEAISIRKRVAAPQMQSPNPTTHNRQDSLRKSVRSSDVYAKGCSGVDSDVIVVCLPWQ
jgi:hypothetical protein